jgi:hypothetical protein
LDSSVERRTTRRFSMALPVSVRPEGKQSSTEFPAETRDVSFRGLYFFADRDFEVGSQIEFVLTLPKEITLATDVHIRCSGSVVRTEEKSGRTGIAAKIERYEFLPKN